MAKVRVVVNQRAVDRLLRETVRPMLEEMGEDIARAAGPGHRVESEVGKRRARVAIITDTNEAVRSEATDRTLSRALDAGRR